MPLVRSERVGTNSVWGLWHISEEEQELEQLAGETCPTDVIVPQKRKEFLAGRSLVRHLVTSFGRQYTGITKNAYGKPLLVGLTTEVSLSHSTPYVAAQLHNSKSVGIDVEQPKEKLLRVASRVLSPEERLDAQDNIVKHCVYWCAKEAMYKIHGERGLHFSTQLNIDPFVLSDQGVLRGRITSKSSTSQVELAYLVAKTFTLVYTL